MAKAEYDLLNSMSDLFHKEIPAEFIERVFDTMEQADWHTFQVLTKRSSLMRNFLRRRYGAAFGPQHIWCGVSIEDGSKRSRVRHLQGTPAGTRFLSIEPLIGRVGKIDLNGIDWVIVGGESGPQARYMDPDWVREIRDQCYGAGIPFFFKQWGGPRPKSGGRVLDGEEWNQFPLRPSRNHQIAAELAKGRETVALVFGRQKNWKRSGAHLTTTRHASKSVLVAENLHRCVRGTGSVRSS